MEKFKKGDLVFYVGDVLHLKGKLFIIKDGTTKKSFFNKKLMVFVEGDSQVKWFYSHNLVKICNVKSMVNI